MDESTKAKIAGLLEQAEQEAEQRGYTAGLAAGTEAARRAVFYEEPFGGRRHGPAPASGPYDNSPEARLRRHQALWDLLDDKTDRIAELEAEVARLQGLVPAVMPEYTGPSIEEMKSQRRERAEALAAEKKPKKGGSK